MCYFSSSSFIFFFLKFLRWVGSVYDSDAGSVYRKYVERNLKLLITLKRNKTEIKQFYDDNFDFFNLLILFVIDTMR